MIEVKVNTFKIYNSLNKEYLKIKEESDILFCFRGHTFRDELLPLLIKFKKSNISLLYMDAKEVQIIKFLMKLNNLNSDKLKFYTYDEMEKKMEKKQMADFDYVLTNPPYQKQVGLIKTEKIWQTLMNRFINDLLRPNGIIAGIHPGAWRFTSNGSKKGLIELKNTYATNEILYMELNDIDKGYETFGVGTDYDVIVMKKTPSNKKISVNTLNGIEDNVDIKNIQMIPTNKLDDYINLTAKSNEETAEILYSRSAYGTDKKWTSDKKSKEFKHPCLYSITEKKGKTPSGKKRKGHDLNFFYANTDQNGHFGVAKLIFKKGATTSLLDLEGKYGLCQFAVGIVDTPDNLKRIQLALASPEATDLKLHFFGATTTPRKAFIDGLGHMFKAMVDFRKDFWKEYYTEEMEQQLITSGEING